MRHICLMITHCIKNLQKQVTVKTTWLSNTTIFTPKTYTTKLCLVIQQLAECTHHHYNKDKLLLRRSNHTTG
jgi:hypothetical protein